MVASATLSRNRERRKATLNLTYSGQLTHSKQRTASSRIFHAPARSEEDRFTTIAAARSTPARQGAVAVVPCAPPSSRTATSRLLADLYLERSSQGFHVRWRDHTVDEPPFAYRALPRDVSSM